MIEYKTSARLPARQEMPGMPACGRQACVENS